jgi:MFS transporter, DHA1 family, multidrug resistance protein
MSGGAPPAAIAAIKASEDSCDAGVERSSRRLGLTLLIAALTALPAMSIDMSLPALPDLAADLGIGSAAAQLSISLFLAGFAAAQLLCGSLSDRFGRRPVLLAGLRLFAATGLLCAAAPTLPVLLAGRVFQGVGACAGTVIARAIIRDLHSGEEAAVKLSQATTIMALAPVLAPSIGGMLHAGFGWRSIFLVLGSCGTALVLVTAFGLPETIRTMDRAALNPATMASHFMNFFRCRMAIGNALVAALLFGGMFSYIAASPFAVMQALGAGTSAYAAIFAVTALGIMAGSYAGTRLIRRVGARRLIVSGLALGATTGVTLLALALGGGVGIGSLAVLVALYTTARGLVVPAATAAALQPMGHSAGLASGLLGALQMGAATAAVSAVGLFSDPLIGIGATLALFGIGALVFCLVTKDVPERSPSIKERVRSSG